MKIFTRRKAETPYLSVQVPPRKPASVPNLRVPEEIEGLWFRMSAGENFSQSAGYRVRAVAHPAEDGHTIEGEPNDTQERAIGVEVGEMVRGYLHSPSDLDRFQLAVGRELPSELDEAEGEVAEEKRDVSESTGRDTGTESEDTETGDTATDGDEAADAGFEPVYVPPIERVAQKEQADHVIQVGLRPIAKTDRLALVHGSDEQGANPVTVEAEGRGDSVKLCNLAVDEALIDIAIRGKHVEPRQLRDDYTYELTTVDILSEVDQLEIEPNDGRENADRLEFGTPRTGFIAKAGDTDVYAFGIPDPRKMEALEEQKARKAGGAPETSPDENSGADETDEELPPAKPVSVEIALKSNRLNLGFDVLDSAGAKIAEIDRSGAGVNESTSLDLPPGLYFVEVSSGRDFECRPYELTVSRD